MELNSEKKNKLQMAWSGPYRIHECLNDLNYEVDVVPGEEMFREVHRSMLKSYYDRENLVYVVCRADGEKKGLPDLTCESEGDVISVTINNELSVQQVKQVLYIYI